MKKFLLLILLASTTLMAQQKPEHTVDVVGEGIVYIVPDEVSVKVRVENTGKNPKEIKQENDRIVNNVLSFLKSMKIEDKHVSTDYIRLSKNYEYNTKTYNYSANQAITVIIKDLKKYEAVMNGLIESGINRIDGVQFSSSEMKTLESEARKRAVMDAKKKATEYAEVLNQSIGKAISISEYQSVRNMPQPLYKSVAMDMSSGESQQTIAPGEMEIKVNVNVSFLLN